MEARGNTNRGEDDADAKHVPEAADAVMRGKGMIVCLRSGAFRSGNCRRTAGYVRRPLHGCTLMKLMKKQLHFINSVSMLFRVLGYMNFFRRRNESESKYEKL
jgi:hypothetical protein